MACWSLSVNASKRLKAVLVWHEAEDELTETEVIWVEPGYSGENLARVVQQICDARVEVIERISKTFKILPKRWVVERICRLVEPLLPLE